MVLALLIPFAILAVITALVPVLFVIIRDERERRAQTVRAPIVSARTAVRGGEGERVAA